MSKDQSLPSAPVARSRWLSILGWTLVCLLTGLWLAHLQEVATLAVAEDQARSSIQRDIIYRRWSALHGGTYVPITEQTPPNPYLSHLPERDIQTTTGRELTLVNPAYMTRQAHELGHREYGLHGHITSLNPIRPENTPDYWERRALTALAAGGPTQTVVAVIDDREHLRLMEPLTTEAGCLKCHAAQGYKLGDQRGGISVAVPLAQLRVIGRAQLSRSLTGLAAVYCLGLLGLVLVFRRLEGSLVLQARAFREVVRSRELFDSFMSFLPGRGFIKNRRGEYLYASRVMLDSDRGGYPDLLERRAGDVSPWMMDEGRAAAEERVWTTGRADERVERGPAPEGGRDYLTTRFPLTGPEGEQLLGGLGVDVTERRQAESDLLSQQRQRAVMAELGQRALSATDGRALTDDSLGFLARELEVDLVKVMELSPDARNLLLVAGLGWAEGTVGRAEVGVGLESQAGFTLTTSEPVVVGDLNTETRFSGPGLLADHRVVSGVSVIIGDLTDPYGVLGVHTTAPREFSVNEINLIQNIANILAVFSHRQRAERKRRQLEDQLRQSQKMEAVGTLAGGVAHDFNNILSAMIGYTELVVADLPPDSPGREDLDQVIRNGWRARDLTTQLLAFSRRQVLNLAIINLNQVVETTRRILDRLIGEDIEIGFELDPDLGNVRADFHQLEQVLINLVINARDAMPHGGRVTVETSARRIAAAAGPGAPGPGRYVRLTVSDTGHGMDSQTLSQIFDPFFTTKQRGRGTGLGLSTIYGIVRQHGGHVEAQSQPGQGSAFTLLLPRVDGPLTEGPGREGPTDRPGGTETVLVVEDEAPVRRYVVKALTSLGYRVIEAVNGLAALEMIADGPAAEMDLVLTDVVMPRMSGRALVEKLTRLRPGLKTIYMSGYTDDVVARHGVLERDEVLLQKPFSVSRLAATVRRVLDS